MSHNPLQHFFYLLMRDHLPTGAVESVMLNVRKAGIMDVTYSSTHLAAYAAELSHDIHNLTVKAVDARHCTPTREP